MKFFSVANEEYQIFMLLFVTFSYITSSHHLKSTQNFIEDW